MNSANRHEQREGQFTGATPQKCFVCGDQFGEHCFCKIHRKEEGPIMLCCPGCTMQYLDSVRIPDLREQEHRVYENSVHFFIGEDKPWS